jgi:hypothetical protein
MTQDGVRTPRFHEPRCAECFKNGGESTAFNRGADALAESARVPKDVVRNVIDVRYRT